MHSAALGWLARLMFVVSSWKATSTLTGDGSPRESCPVAKLCRDAIGIFSATLAWGTSDSRVQTFHMTSLVCVGFYAFLLPWARPAWLENNISAEAARVGNSLEKQRYIFQVAVTVLSLLNFGCLAMLVLASRAMRSFTISRLTEQRVANEKFRGQFLRVLRTSYSVSVLLLLLVMLIYAVLSRLSRLPHPGAFVLGWSPAFFSAWALLQLVTCIRLLAALAMNEVECYYQELESTGSGCIEAQDFVAQVQPGHWLRLLREHQDLLRDLKAVSSSISATVLVFQNVVAGSSLLLLWVARAYQKDPAPSTGYVVLAFTLICSGIFAMVPLAYITDLCQSRRLGRRSLLTLADKFSGWPMSMEVHAEYMRFMQHLNTAEAGIYLPNMGMVTRASLTNQIMFYVKVLPLALAITLGWWRRG
ncbi:unnamed protein product [Effrenium voratum]|uniref:Gustatory receptor n=1 Tax=Effrenium voratum TaxID=2562239 RepID=A0AA36NMU3_9DINO|nr:unnamed protein product [Effrenium voratum]CAJ1410153.1 unnamed protein product [Effrenium voratum]CAJ1426736.1 unnamed protein product [Effrenium voratum]|mmetsp:Transcript_79863/g.191753  ORF Transcript_79863/g.191753 Transcript_79863/m.191753 type:complete len:418 (-) Transcript_79863:225-1478(-)